MKQIKEVLIWQNGSTKRATIINAYVVNLILNQSATFYYGLSTQNEDGSVGETISQGNLSMTGEDYARWIIDNDAWDYIANSLNIEVIGDYVTTVSAEPIAEAVVEETIVATVAETTTVEEPILSDSDAK
jgi:hypothetical protein